MTDEEKTTTKPAAKKPAAKKPAVSPARPVRRRRTRPVGVPGFDIEHDDIIEENEFERVRQLPHDVQVFEEKMTKMTKAKVEYDIWQPYGRSVPVLLITYPTAFTKQHEDVLRLEPSVEKKENKVIKCVIKRHDVEGETFFELGETDADADRVIEYAIELLKGQGVAATRDFRFTPFMNRQSW